MIIIILNLLQLFNKSLQIKCNAEIAYVVYYLKIDYFLILSLFLDSCLFLYYYSTMQLTRTFRVHATRYFRWRVLSVREREKESEEYLHDRVA